MRKMLIVIAVIVVLAFLSVGLAVLQAPQQTQASLPSYDLDGVQALPYPRTPATNKGTGNLILTEEQELVDDIALKVEELPEGWFVYSHKFPPPSGYHDIQAYRDAAVSICFNNEKYAASEDVIRLYHDVYLCWEEQAANYYVDDRRFYDIYEDALGAEIELGDEGFYQYEVRKNTIRDFELLKLPYKWSI